MPDIKRVDRSMRDFAHGNELGRRFWCTKIPLDTPLAGLVTADPAFAVIESDLLQGMTGLWSDRNQGSSERLGQCPASALRVESRCDAVALGSNISVAAPFHTAVPYWFDPGPVFTPRSSNRTGRFPASGARTRLHAFACNAICSF